MVNPEAALILFLLLTVCSLIFVHRWFSVIQFSHGDDQSIDDLIVTIKDEDQFLTCDHLDEIIKISVIGEGAVKVVWLAKWRESLIALSQLKTNFYQDDFNHNLEMIQRLADSGKVIKLLGICNNSIIMTQFHPFGNPLNLLVWNNFWPNPIINGLGDCLKLCLQFVDLINYLHSHPSGPLVMCDSNTLDKLLSQLLLSIVDHDSDFTVNGLQLIFNDLDALPNVQQGKGIKCGSRQLVGTFVAPEQLWPYPDEPFNDNLMPPYNEKIDIWKIPDVCLWFIKLSSSCHRLIGLLEPIHDQCKHKDPKLRPNASTIHQEYRKIYQQLSIETKSDDRDSNNLDQRIDL